MTQSTDLPEGWTAHDGGECPVPPDSRPAVMFGDGRQIAAGVRRAGYHLVGYWAHHFGPSERIIAYKPEQPQ